MDLKYLTKEESEKLELNLALSGIKKTVLADLIGCSYGYLSAMINRRKKISVDNVKSIDFVLDKYIMLHKELSKESKKEVSKNRVKDKYYKTLTALDSVSGYHELGVVTLEVDDDYLRNKLNESLDFGLDSSMNLKMLVSCLKNVFYLYG